MANTQISSFPVAISTSINQDYVVLSQYSAPGYIDKRISVSGLMSAFPALSVNPVVGFTAYGTTPTVTITGTVPNQILTFSIPAGTPGSMSSTGGGYAAGAFAVYNDSTGNVLKVASVATVRTTLGLGSLALLNTVNNSNWSGTALTVANGGTGQTAAGATTANAIGALAQASNLSDVASVSTTRTNLGLGSAALQATSAFLQPSNNLSDVASVATARATLGAAQSGANNDITSLSALTVPLASQAASNFNFCAGITF